MNIKIGQIVENILSTGQVIVCRVIELNVAGTDMVRITDARETDSDAKLIAKNRTWAAPIANLRPHDTDCAVCHQSGLVILGVN